MINCNTINRVESDKHSPAYWPTDEWKYSTPEEQGIDSQVLYKLFKKIQQENLNIHSLIIVRNNYVVSENYFWPYNREVLHNTYSCTKSITSMLIGICIEQGYIKNKNQKVLDFFKDKNINNINKYKKAMTIEDLLTMRSGFNWYKAQYWDMRLSKDSIQFMLDQPVKERPGSGFQYNSASIHLLSAIIQQESGMSALSYAQKYLFNPLGIKNVLWAYDSKGINWGDSTLSLKPLDMAKTGCLYLYNGVWEDKQIVPKSWIKHSLKKSVQKPGEEEYYGYLWYMYPFGAYSARGAMGQYIFVVPGLNIVVVFTNETNGDFKLPIELVRDYIIPAAKSSSPIILDNTDVHNKLKTEIDKMNRKPIKKEIPEAPLTAKNFSGREYILEKNPLGINTISFTFKEKTASANYTIYVNNELKSQEFPIGLDNVYRIAEYTYLPVRGLFLAAKGEWESDNTFTVYYEILGRDRVILKCHFTHEKIDIYLKNLMYNYTSEFSGKILDKQRK